MDPPHAAADGAATGPGGYQALVVPKGDSLVSGRGEGKDVSVRAVA